MNETYLEATDRVLRRCREMGFALAGVCDATPTDYEREMLGWLASGRHGEMGYLARHIELRLDPTKFVPEARSIICVADRYAGLSPLLLGEGPGVRAAADSASCSTVSSEHPHPGPLPQGEGESSRGRIARYARGKDYHRIMRDRLGKFCRAMVKDFPSHRFRSCVDTAPVLEREYAQRAGLGAIGKNTMLLERSVGSWLLLGEIITTLPLAASRPADPDPCGTCTRCIDACPTRAIASEGWSLDATRCISYLTIEHRSVIDEQFYAAIDDWLFGCDICQEVCPHNAPKSQNADAATHEAYSPRHEALNLLAVLNWTEADRARVLANSAMKRARLDMLKRNAIIALGNACAAGDVELIARLKRAANDESESAIVRQTASVVVARLDVTARPASDRLP